MPAHTIFTQDIADRICARLSEGEPLAQICRDDGFPDPSTWRDWCAKDETLAFAYAHAREVGYDAIAHRTRETARGLGDSAGDVQRDKLIIETDLKLLAKWSPKRYGDKVNHEVTGADGGPVQVQRIERVVVDPTITE